MKPLSVVKPSGWLKITVYGLLLIGIYYSTLTWLIFHDWARKDYSYCYLIPFIVLYLVWEKRKSLLEISSMSSWLGLIPFLLGLFFFWLGELGGEIFSIYISIWLVVFGLSWLHMGSKKLRILAFPFFIALAMFPLPSFFNNKLTLHLKLISSQLGVAMMQLFGMSAYRDGNIIDLGFTQLQVVDACSGLRFLIPLLILSILLAYFFRATLWKKAIIVLSSVPLSIVTNSLRIAITGLLYEAWGAKVAEGFFHGFSGWFIFMFSLAVLLFEMWILGKIPRLVNRGSMDQRIDPEGLSDQTKLSQANMEETESDKKAEPVASAGKGLSALLRPPQFLVAVILLGATLALSNGVDFREKIPITRPFSDFPLELGHWTGTRDVMEQKFIDALDFSDYILIDYRNDRGEYVNFYVAYYESQRKGESIHSPASCLPGGGWSFKQAGLVTIPSPGYYGGSMRVKRALMEKGDAWEISYYWFPQRNRVLTSLYQLKLFAFWDALTKHRTDGALVRVITPVYENEKVEKAEKRLQDFIKVMIPVLMEYLPSK